MKLIKRNGAEVVFDKTKISAAITKANMAVDEDDRISERDIARITDNVEKLCIKMHRSVGVEEVQDLVEDQLMKLGAHSIWSA